MTRVMMYEIIFDLVHLCLIKNITYHFDIKMDIYLQLTLMSLIL